MNHIDDNRSVWMAVQPPRSPAPPLRGETTADLAIIGAGFTGMSTAYHVGRRFPDRRVVLLEAKVLANGASGRNGGLMLNWINGVPSVEPGLTSRVYACTRDGIDGIEAIIKEHALPVRYGREGCLEVYTDAARAEEAHRKTEKLRSWGIPVKYLQGQALTSRLRARGAVGAVLDPTAGRINGVDLVRGMAGVLGGNVEIYENTPVTRIEEGGTCTLSTPEGVVRAKAIVLATNGYTARLGYFRGGIFPLHSHVLATEPLSPAQREAAGWGANAGFSDDMDRIAYGGITEDGALVFGGGSNASYGYRYGGQVAWAGSAESGFAAVRRRLLELFPGAEPLAVAHRWTGTLGITLSRNCTMGVRGEHRNVYYALGYSGHGVTLANLAGRVLCDVYSGDDARWRELPFYDHRLAWIPPDPFRWAGYHFYTSITGRSPRRAA